MFSGFRSLTFLLANSLRNSRSLELCGQFLAMVLPLTEGHRNTDIRRQAACACSHRGDTVRSFCGAVDGFDKGDTAATFEAGLVAAEIGNGGSGGALVFVEGDGAGGG